jgi:hypothetical protein
MLPLSYRLFFNEHLQLSGWFEYFNGLDYDEEMSRIELEKVRQKLRNKLKVEGNDYMKESPEELKILVHDHEFNIEKKLLQLTKNMRQAAEDIRQQREQIRVLDRKDEVDEELEGNSVFMSRNISTNDRTGRSSD